MYVCMYVCICITVMLHTCVTNNQTIITHKVNTNWVSFRDDSAEWHGPRPCKSKKSMCSSHSGRKASLLAEAQSLFFILILSLFCMLLISHHYFCLCCSVHIVSLTFLYFLPFALHLCLMSPLHLSALVLTRTVTPLSLLMKATIGSLNI